MTSRKTPGNSRRFPFLLSLIIVFLYLSSCGLETYPYLFPAERLGVTGSEAEGFRHDPKNADTGVFKGYELFYRIYRKSDFTDADNIDSAITSDMHSYFNGTNDFYAISRDDMGDTGLSADSDKGYRRFYIEGLVDTIPLLGGSEPFEAAELAERFEVDINRNAESAIFLSISDFDYPEYELKRNTISDSSSDFVSFSENMGDYSTADNDILFETPESEYILLVAIFVVPYGKDDFSSIFANGTSEDMTYIGYFEYQL